MTMLRKTISIKNCFLEIEFIYIWQIIRFQIHFKRQPHKPHAILIFHNTGILKHSHQRGKDKLLSTFTFDVDDKMSKSYTLKKM